MSNGFEKRGQGDVRSQYAPEILKKATDAARELLKTPEEMVRRFQFGQEVGELFVSKDPTLVVGSEILEVDGEKFYIGVNMKEET